MIQSSVLGLTHEHLTSLKKVSDTNDAVYYCRTVRDKDKRFCDMVNEEEPFSEIITVKSLKQIQDFQYTHLQPQLFINKRTKILKVIKNAKFKVSLVYQMQESFS